MTANWEPAREYTELSISELCHGPRAVVFAGRVVNTTTIWGKSAKEPRARGWHYILLKDDGGAVSVRAISFPKFFMFVLGEEAYRCALLWQIKLYFASKQFPLLLGALMTVWTVFISDAATTDSTVVPGVDAYANLFPGRVTSDHIMIHEGNEGTNGACRAPLGYRVGEPLAGLSWYNFYIVSQILTEFLQ